MKKFLIAAMLGGLLGVVVAPQLAGPLLAKETDQAETYKQLELFGDIFDRIRAEYVEEVDDKKLIEAAINGMLTSLDPHSSYLSPDDASDMRIQTRGAFGGLGIEVTQEDGFVKVITPIDDTPAAKAGVEPGDFITHVDGESLLGLTLDEAVQLMRGPVGSEIVITVARESESEPFDIKIIRDTIKLTAVRDKTIGQSIVMRVSTFNDQTYPNLEDGIAKQIEAAGGIENINGFVIDLRNNPGGLLNQAIKVSDAFLEKGEIVSTRGRAPEDGDRWNARAGDLAQGKPIVVLINGGSASASEIVAGALQDHRRAIVVGTKSFGKGSVQTIMPVAGDGAMRLTVGTKSFGKGSVQTIMPVAGDGAMRLTTARYYTPSGRSIQALGVSPDIIVQQPRKDPNSTEDEAAEDEGTTRTEADLRGSLDNDSLSDADRDQIEQERARAEEAAKLRDEDFQLSYAIDLLKGLSAIQPAQ